MIILSLLERDAAAVRQCLAGLQGKVDVVEVRLDALRRPDPSGWLPRGGPPSIPVIATCRRHRDGGGFRGGEAARRDLLAASAREGAAFVDLESGSSLARDPAFFEPARVILSRHYRRNTPPLPELRRLRRELSSTPGIAAVKIVTTARDPADMVAIRRLLAEKPVKGVPLAAFAMGPEGIASRILALAWGSWATYVCLERGREAAPGQITLSEALDLYRIPEIDEGTHILGITGDPVAHSLSPVMHNAALARQGLNWRYLPFPARKVLRLREWMRGLHLRGLSVTSPHKAASLRALHRLEPEARAIGAVNTIINDGRRLLGFNTDAQGILEPVRERLDPEGLSAAILGAGGSARAAAAALASAGAEVLVASRRVGPGRALARACGGRHVPIERIGKERYSILVNATPVGTRGREMPVSAAAVRGDLVVDLIYRTGGTHLLRLAADRGIPTVGGHEILLAQGIRQYSLFTGRIAPVDLMRDTVTRSLTRAAAPAG